MDQDARLGCNQGYERAPDRPDIEAEGAEILGQIKAYEAQIAHAKHDLAHVNATIELFAAPERQRARYIMSHGFFKKGEIADICVRQLGDGAQMTTRELAERVMIERDKGGLLTN